MNYLINTTQSFTSITRMQTVNVVAKRNKVTKYKLKKRSAAAKRFKITGSGHIKFYSKLNPRAKRIYKKYGATGPSIKMGLMVRPTIKNGLWKYAKPKNETTEENPFMFLN
eukprot:TRINITY_DN2715_c0_g1_i1.p2 TRINITY_DN2715_c0_g1~~TRINITY_DN2715_c0_g1_i1.p2  ORF type:complete len:111 (-),score=20.15 TRINITY_DN2715_c0_g1_i1:54-386(-)